jgi:hypothetical protein
MPFIPPETRFDQLAALVALAKGNIAEAKAIRKD